MFDTIKGYITDLFKSRIVVLAIVFIAMAVVLLHRLFQLQIIDGEEYENTFDVRIKKESILPCTRGLIYDCNGELLAYNELVYSVAIEDNGDYDTLKEKNDTINPALMELFSIIESHGDSLVNDFEILLNASNEYEYTVDGKEKTRFLSNVYGVSVDKLKKEQKYATAEDVMNYLCNSKHYNLSEEQYSRSDILKMVGIRFDMSLNNYQKYVTTTVASDVSAETVAIVMEHQADLPGVSIQEDTVRRYHEFSQCASHIIGYTGKVSEEQLRELQSVNEKYNENYIVGKAGIEEAMEEVLQGTQGKEVFYVDNLGKVIDVEERVESTVGNDVYLTIDINLQKTIYNILEQHLAGIISSKIVNESAYTTRKINDSDDVVISIDDVYFALVDNNVINIEHFSKEDASQIEKQVYGFFQQKLQEVTEQLREQLTGGQALPKKELSEQYQSYMDYLYQSLLDEGLLIKSKIESTNEQYQSWKTGESSLRDFLYYCISQNWVDVNRISSKSAYADADEIYQYMVGIAIENLVTDNDFHKRVYEYLILDHVLNGRELCLILYDQGVLQPDAAKERLSAGTLGASSFIISKINALEITPAQLALDPCSASVVITDVQTGQVKALVTYPSYDNKKLANRIDASYYNQLLNDQSLPLFNRATQQKSAPGSTFKMLTSIAGLEEGVITVDDLIEDEGKFMKISNTPRCWYFPSKHGKLNVAQALEHSCNYFFYEVGYRLSMDENEEYDEDIGIEKLTYYAEKMGLGEKSGVEIEESAPNISKKYPVMAAIGQAEHNFTTVQLSKYVTAVANGGTVYDLTLIDKTMTAEGDLIQRYEPKIYQETDFAQTTWNAVQSGMRLMAQSASTLNKMGVAVAGKTGTAQEDSSRPNHALFVGYAPYENPEISIAVKIPYGYNSSNATAVAKDVWNYYFELRSYEQVVDGQAVAPGAEVIHD